MAKGEGGGPGEVSVGRLVSEMGVEGTGRAIGRLQRIGHRLGLVQRLRGKLDYAALGGISNEAREKLGRLRPRTLGAAGRIDGVRPSDVALVGSQVQRMRGGA